MSKKKDTPVLFNDLTTSFFPQEKQISHRIQTVLRSGRYINGFQVAQLEKAMTQFFNHGRFVTVASGHDALFLGLNSLHLNSYDEILFPVNAYPTAFPVCQTLGKPVGVDCDKNGQIDIDDVQKKITKNTKAVVVVHLYGLMTDIEAISKLCRTKNILLIEDCAQSFGSKFQNKYVGTWGDIGCFSFYPTKNIATFGDGGAILIKSKEIYDYVSKAKSYGEVKRYESVFVSGHSRISEIQAAILNSAFENRESLFQSRKDLYKYYKTKLGNLKLKGRVRLLQSHVDSESIPHLVVIEADQRDKLRNHLTKAGIETMIHYPKPVHLLPAFRSLGYKRGDFPVAERLSRKILSLPFYTLMEISSIDRVIDSIQKFYG
jgi:dTDP-4-amino-4,6-dideoxygalactose transaminase